VPSDIKTRISAGDAVVSVDKEVPAGDTVDVSGQIEFNSEAMSKQDIEAMGPLLTGFRINSYEVVLVSGN